MGFKKVGDSLKEQLEKVQRRITRIEDEITRLRDAGQLDTGRENYLRGRIEDLRAEEKRVQAQYETRKGDLGAINHMQGSREWGHR